jgi:hypothetical protein
MQKTGGPGFVRVLRVRRKGEFTFKMVLWINLGFLIERILFPLQGCVFIVESVVLAISGS